MIHYFMFDGKSSREFGIYISGSGVFNAPERDVEVVEIPGRNGNLILDNGRFFNHTAQYPAFIRQKFPAYADAARGWLLSKSGYCRLEDTYYPEYFRLARFSGPLDFDVRFQNTGGEVTLSFDCKPQRFLKSGEQKIVVSGAASILNPTGFQALPLIKVFGSGSGSFSVGESVVSVQSLDGYLTLDCDLQAAYKGKISKNSSVSLLQFPILQPRRNEISISGGITKLEIIPRWWTI